MSMFGCASITAKSRPGSPTILMSSGGRNFSPDIASDRESAYILNETAVRELGIEDPIGKSFSWRKGTVTSGYGRADSKAS